MDNLNTHWNQIVAAMINIHGHQIVFRAPYYPVDGPIEYVFNTVQQSISFVMYQIHDHDDLLVELNVQVGAIPDFVNYFRHCGFIRE